MTFVRSFASTQLVAASAERRSHPSTSASPQIAPLVVTTIVGHQVVASTTAVAFSHARAARGALVVS